MLKAVIFDFDGVISDTEMLHLETFNVVLKRYDIEISRESYFSKYLGLSDLDFFNELVSEGRLKLDIEAVKALVLEKKAIYEKIVRDDGRIINGVRDFLDLLKKHDVMIAICSGALKHEIELILDGAGLKDYFEVLVSADQVQRSKPDPEGFLLTIKRLNEKSNDVVEARDCVVIEDSHWGLDAAKAAGTHTIAVTNSYGADELRSAEKVVANLGELSINDLQTLCG